MLGIQGFEYLPFADQFKTTTTRVVILNWLELADIFQTFEELDEAKDKQEYIHIVRQLIDGDIEIKPDDKETIC